MGLSCPSCDGPVGGPYRRGRRWRIVVHHKPFCAARTIPAARWWVHDTLIGAAFGVPGADGDEVEVAHRVSARLAILAALDDADQLAEHELALAERGGHGHAEVGRAGVPAHVWPAQIGQPAGTGDEFPVGIGEAAARADVVNVRVWHGPSAKFPAEHL